MSVIARIIAILSSKGGTGKTTIVTNIAGCLYQRGHSVIIVDSDPQGTTRDWHHARPENLFFPPVIGIDRPVLHRNLPQLAKGYDYVVIDGTARLEEMSASTPRWPIWYSYRSSPADMTSGV